MQSINGRGNRIAKTLLAIPLIVFVVAVLCFVIACFLERPTHRGDVYSFLMGVSIFSALLMPPLCLGLSCVGMALAHQDKKKETPWDVGTFVMGLLEVIFSLLFIAFGLYAVFVFGPRA